jgi:hypothetical protein
MITAPYTPGFGRQPLVLAGRDAILDRAARAIQSGPGHPDFVFALLGYRGVGKTTLLDSIGERVKAQLGWPVLHLQAVSDESLVGTIAERLPTSLQPWGRLGRDFKRLEASLTVGLNLGIVSASASVRSPAEVPAPPSSAALEELLRRVGEFAHKHKTGLLVTIDEAQAAGSSDMSGLARAAQTVVSRQQLPVAIIFAGLPAFRERMAAAGTFAARLPTEVLGELGTDATRVALVEPAARFHVAWEPDALEMVIARSEGHPYFVQLFGYHVWLAADGAATIDVNHAVRGIEAARRELDGQFSTTWGRLRAQERDYLNAVAALGGVTDPVPVDAVAQSMGRQARQLAVIRDRLVHAHGLLFAPQRGHLLFASRQMGEWVAGHAPSRPGP